MIKGLAIALATAGAVTFAVPAANAAPRLDGLTQDLSAQTVVVKKRHHRRTVVRTYPAPKYYGSYYGPTYYERPYSRPPAVVFGLGGWW